VHFTVAILRGLSEESMSPAAQRIRKEPIMSIFKTDSLKALDEQTKYGFELAIRYAELAVKYDKEPIAFMKEYLAEWNGQKRSEEWN
jgi:hypothetical protein